MRVKVCGITREEDARLAVELGAWAVGLVLAPGSPRRVTMEAAAAARAAVPPGTLAVGVFADQARNKVLDAMRALRLDAVQLHGSETPEYCSSFPVPVFKSLTADACEDPEVLGAYGAEAFLVEPERGAGDRAAGVGPSRAAQKEAWEAARRLGMGHQVILAGGLDPGNAALAAETAKPFALDVSSGVERAPGIKDPKKLRAFFEALRDL